MKAILEFTYPQDERKLLYAVKGHDMYVALVNIRLQITKEFTHKADMADVLARVRELTDDIFHVLGD
jgi:hypothetical protein